MVIFARKNAAAVFHQRRMTPRLIRASLPFVVLFLVFLGYYESVNGPIRAEFNRIRAAKEPLTDQDFDALFDPIDPEKNCTELLNKAETLFAAKRDFGDGGKYQEVPVIARSWRFTARPLPNEKWEADVLTAELLKQQQPVIDLLWQCGERGFQAKFPSDLQADAVFDESHKIRVPEFLRLLLLQSYWLTHKDEGERAKPVLLLALKFHRTLEAAPNSTDQLRHSAMLQRVLESYFELSAYLSFNNSELEMISEELARIDVFKALRLSLLADRAAYEHYCGHLAHYVTLLDEDDARRLNNPLALMFLQLQLNRTRMPDLENQREILAGQLNWPNLIAKAQALDAKLAVNKDANPNVKPPVDANATTIFWAANFESRLRCAKTLIAIQKYRLAKGGFPANLQALVPEFMKEPLVDPFTSKPLQYDRDENFICVHASEAKVSEAELTVSQHKQTPYKLEHHLSLGRTKSLISPKR